LNVDAVAPELIGIGMDLGAGVVAVTTVEDIVGWLGAALKGDQGIAEPVAVGIRVPGLDGTYGWVVVIAVLVHGYTVLVVVDWVGLPAPGVCRV